MSDDDERNDDDETTGDDADETTGGDTAAPDDTSTSDDASTATPSDDASGDDDASDAPSAPTDAASASATSSKGQKLSAGARLAAAKAAKAAAKAAKKQARREEAGATQSAAQREAEDLASAKSAEDVLKESPLGRAATRAGEWTQANRQLAMGIMGIAAVALIGWLGWTWWTASQASAAGALLADALEISSAEIVTADDTSTHHDDDADEDDAPTFESIDARNTAALAAYRRVSSEYPSSAAAAWARLGEGRTLLAEGEYADARTAYQAAFDTSGDETIVAWQALEGLGASYEAESDWEHATAAYERLASLADHAYESVANYHLARMHAAAGDESAALTSFRELVDALREEGDEGEPPFPYVLAQADERLRELDPSAAGAGPRLGGGGGAPEGEEGGNPLEGLSPEQIQELIQRLQTKSGGSLPPQ